MTRHIVACGGGGWPSDARSGPLEDYVLGLIGPERPRVCLLPTASGDSDWLIARFYEVFSERDCRPSHLTLFRPHPAEIARQLLAQDLIYVGGGSSANLLAIWALHGLGPVLREAWERGVILAGVSAGAICWFEHGLTNSIGPGFAPVTGLGLVEGGFCPHADSDPRRVPVLRGLVEQGAMPPSLAVDDGAAVHLSPGESPRIVAALPGRGVSRIGPGGARERLEVTPLWR